MVSFRELKRLPRITLGKMAMALARDVEEEGEDKRDLLERVIQAYASVKF